MKQHQQCLLQLCAGWQRPLESVSTELDFNSWCPSAEELSAVQVSAVMPAVSVYNDEDTDDDLGMEDGEEEDDGLIAAMEALDFADGYQDLLVEDNDCIQ